MIKGGGELFWEARRNRIRGTPVAFCSPRAQENLTFQPGLAGNRIVYDRNNNNNN